MDWQPAWNLKSIPAPELNAEVGRRRQLLRRSRNGGRPATMAKCPLCGEEMTTRELWSHYNPQTNMHRAKRTTEDQKSTGGGVSPVPAI